MRCQRQARLTVLSAEACIGCGCGCLLSPPCPPLRLTHLRPSVPCRQWQRPRRQRLQQRARRLCLSLRVCLSCCWAACTSFTLTASIRCVCKGSQPLWRDTASHSRRGSSERANDCMDEPWAPLSPLPAWGCVRPVSPPPLVPAPGARLAGHPGAARRCSTGLIQPAHSNHVLLLRSVDCGHRAQDVSSKAATQRRRG